MRDYPRVVVLSMTDISSSTATGSLLRELFNNFPAKNIFQITQTQFSDVEAQRFSLKFQIRYQPGKLYIKRRLRPKKWRKGYAANIALEFLDSLAAFSPEIVYLRVVDDLFPYLDLAEKISEIFDIPIVSHVMDDYEMPLAASSAVIQRLVHRPLFKWDLKSLFKTSSKNFSISAKMGKALEQRYNTKFVEFHNGIEPTDWVQHRLCRDLDVCAAETLQPFTIVMAGSIDERKDADVIRQVAKIVHDLNQSGDLDCRFILNVSNSFISAAQEIAKTDQGVRAQQYLPLEEYRRLLMSADCLLLARNFDDISRAYTGLSFHNKLPEYLASGTPILCIAPEWDGSAQFLLEHSAGVVISTQSDSFTRQKILEMATHPEAFVPVSKNARKIALQEFNINRVRERFENQLIQLVGKAEFQNP